LTNFETGNYQQAMWRWGRRSGKSLLSDVLALYDATMRDELRAKLRPHEPRITAIIAPRLEQASEHIRNCAALLTASPRLKGALVAETTDSLTLTAPPCLLHPHDSKVPWWPKPPTR
jgi:hypothetical protein